MRGDRVGGSWEDEDLQGRAFSLWRCRAMAKEEKFFLQSLRENILLDAPAHKIAGGGGRRTA